MKSCGVTSSPGETITSLTVAKGALVSVTVTVCEAVSLPQDTVY